MTARSKGSKAIEVEEELDRIYERINEIIDSLDGVYREMALEVEGRIYVEGVPPEDALREIERIALEARRRARSGRDAVSAGY